MNKQHILDEIARTAEANDGVPLGVAKFFRETGIKVADWHGKYWVRWGDALKEAGLTPNEMNGAYTDEELVTQMISLVRELGHYPVKGEIRMRCRKDGDFPADNTFRRIGGKREIAAKILAYVRGREGFEDVAAICEPIAAAGVSEASTNVPAEIVLGYVYLIKSGRHYKIGKSNAVGRREREIALQLPDKANTIHTIKTDDPAGIEAYWHRRFSQKRKNGEWFSLGSEDVAAFKRRKFM
jgi:hypothetical protein